MARRRLRLGLVAAATACMVAAAVGAVPGPASGSPDGIRFGAFSGPRTGESDQTAVLRGEATAGRRYDVVREFLYWNSPFPDSFHSWLRETGRTLLLSVRSRLSNGTDIRWQSIIDAQPGSALYTDIEGWADRIKSYGSPIYFTFNHEPESGASSSMGEAPQFIAAWRKIHDIFDARNVTNAKFQWIMTDYAFWVGAQARNHGPDWFPGEDYVDAMGIDAYNWYRCRTGINTAWKSLEQIIRPFRDFGAAYPDEELWLTEWATTEDPAVPGRKAQFYADAQALFQRPDYAQFVGISYFDTRGQGACQWYPDSSATSVSAFRTMANDSFYGGTVPPVESQISFVDAASRNGNLTNHSVTIPSTTVPGDTMLLFFTSNQNPATTTPPAGWTQVDGADPAGLRNRVWSRTATVSDPGSTVVVGNSAISKGDLTVAVYRGSNASPVDVYAVSVQTNVASQHPAPSVTPSMSGDWVVVYWADKSSTSTGHTIPASLTRRRTTTGSGGGHITSTVADTAGAVPAAPTGTFLATGTGLASKWVAFTIALRPE